MEKYNLKGISMFWADEIAKKIKEESRGKPQHVDDMKTPSGRIHVGSLRGVLIHDLVFKALLNLGVKATSTYVFNDLDPMDGLPTYLPQKIYEKYMGFPLFKIPAPDGKSASLGYQYAHEFIETMQILGAVPEIVWSHELYESGKMNKVVKEALDKAAIIRDIYQEVAGYRRNENWYPFQVICPHCGKVGTTVVDGWDGQKVKFTCQKDLVSWACGCGHEGAISPFNGNGKLLWKVDWPAHWKVLGVTVEGAGKDHSSAGGSRDVAKVILEKVYHYPNPFDIPYEWFLAGGRKMSSSKGVGVSARELADILPPRVGRFLFARTNFNRQLNFDPQGMTIPDIFDEYDRCANLFWSEGGDNDQGRAWQMSQIGAVPKTHFLPRFIDVAKYLQMPKVKMEEKFAEVKGGKLTEVEKEEFKIRTEYAKIWIEKYAPQEKTYQVTQEIPQAAADLSQAQKEYLQKVVSLLGDKKWQAEKLQNTLYQAGKEMGLKPKEAFGAIYVSLLGKDHGPKAAWLVLDLNKDFVIERFKKVGEMSSEKKSNQEVKNRLPDISDPNLITIDQNLMQKYPSLIAGIAVIKGVKVVRESPELEAYKQSFLKNLGEVGKDWIESSKAILSYKKLYRQMDVDWHKKMPSPLALRRRIVQGKDLSRVNTCVDAYNLVVVKYGVSAGAFDLDKLKFPAVLREAHQGEKILPLLEDKEIKLNEKEICYFDRIGAYNLDFNYKDAQRTLVTEETGNLWINVEGVYEINRIEVERSLQEVVDSIVRFCGGKIDKMGIVKR